MTLGTLALVFALVTVLATYFFFLGAWVNHRASRGRSPVPTIPGFSRPAPPAPAGGEESQPPRQVKL